MEASNLNFSLQNSRPHTNCYVHYLYSPTIKMLISQNARISSLNTESLRVFSPCVFQLISGYPTIEVLLRQLSLSKNALRQFQKMSTTLVLHPHCTQAGVLCEEVGRWIRGGRVSWESTEPVIMDKHLAPFPPERLQWPQPNHCLPRHWGLLAHPTKSTISPLPACLPASPTLVCPWKHAAKPNTHWWKTNTSRQPRYLTGSKWLREFKLVTHVPPKPRLGQL